MGRPFDSNIIVNKCRIPHASKRMGQAPVYTAPTTSLLANQVIWLIVASPLKKSHNEADLPLNQPGHTLSKIPLSSSLFKAIHEKLSGQGLDAPSNNSDSSSASGHYNCSTKGKQDKTSDLDSDSSSESTRRGLAKGRSISLDDQTQALMKTLSPTFHACLLLEYKPKNAKLFTGWVHTHSRTIMNENGEEE